MDPRGWYSRGYLPHFDDGRSLQAVTYRLADALPAQVIAKLEEQALDDARRRESLEQYIDAGYGSCALRLTENATAVIENWLHHHGAHYWLHAWVVMPNHVHVLIEPMQGQSLPKIVHAWKSYSAKAILKTNAGGPPALPAKRQLWQPDYWDRYVRNERHYRATVEYIHQNPVKAGLVAKAEVWLWSSANQLGARAARPH
jgi:putative transposase